MGDKIRLQKIFTDAGIMSRRAAEKVIADGRVTVNGNVAAVGDKADAESDVIVFDGKRIVPPKGEHTYVMLNKPMGYVTTMSDEKGRKNVTDLVTDIGKRIYPVGRLDMFSEGLLIMTDDGDLACKLTHPSHNVEKTYRVRTKGIFKKEDAEKMSCPMEIDGYLISPAKIVPINSGKAGRDGVVSSSFEITIHEGRNRQIRKMCELCGLTVMRLCRVKVGAITLGDLEKGNWRYLTADEIDYLKTI